ncbi:ATP-grasp domain-containing protein [Gemmobacter caeni]|uniref:ATP-grasp domain-containing protein n=1 Tax=Gemmobacter caeni TaxID=589035 RepID=A0A2T6B931_9RHOB|nr:ATP-grasp domain-containing protein [Gemmobacter caeni]PTX52591.1 ATP-grasp domain-containing protein [Gemmobacter caeni]TWI94952.1 ATP-grasp domain-containing protein [Gemmobacter caeni]
MRILFNHHLSSLPDVISLMRAAVPDLVVIATDQRAGHRVSEVADHFEQEPGTDRDRMPDWYPDWLLDRARGHGAELLIPYRHRVEISAARDRLQTGPVRILHAGTAEVVDLIEDKGRFLRRAEEIGIRVTPFLTFLDGDGFSRALEEMRDLHPGRPLCVKPVVGIYGAGFRTLLTEEEARRLGPADLGPVPIRPTEYRALLDLHGGGREIMLMPLMRDPERSVDFACLDGVLLGAVSRLKGGSEQMVGPDPVGLEMARRLVKDMRLSGLLNLQTMEDLDGEQHLLELNGRMSGGVGITGLSGVNLPGLLLRALRGEIPNAPVTPEATHRVVRRDLYALRP